jgi:hypothetical protein
VYGQPTESVLCCAASNGVINISDDEGNVTPIQLGRNQYAEVPQTLFDQGELFMMQVDGSDGPNCGALFEEENGPSSDYVEVLIDGNQPFVAAPALPVSDEDGAPKAGDFCTRAVGQSPQPGQGTSSNSSRQTGIGQLNNPPQSSRASSSRQQTSSSRQGTSSTQGTSRPAQSGGGGSTPHSTPSSQGISSAHATSNPRQGGGGSASSIRTSSAPTQEEIFCCGAIDSPLEGVLAGKYHKVPPSQELIDFEDGTPPSCGYIFHLEGQYAGMEDDELYTPAAPRTDVTEGQSCVQSTSSRRATSSRSSVGTCGNGKLEDGEECDCGDGTNPDHPELCKFWTFQNDAITIDPKIHPNSVSGACSLEIKDKKTGQVIIPSCRKLGWFIKFEENTGRYICALDSLTRAGEQLSRQIFEGPNECGEVLTRYQSVILSPILNLGSKPQ